jgi:pimeloyl-ACP methyl ester carboxylesterase
MAQMCELVCHKHGSAPYRAAALHGGPGAPGSVKGIIDGLKDQVGVLEPIQTKKTIDELVEELKLTLEKEAKKPVTLIGHSWGAMFGVIFTARHPELVSSLILVGSGMFDGHENTVKRERMSRLTPREQQEFLAAQAAWKRGDKRQLSRMLELLDKSDDYKPLPSKDDKVEANAEQNRLVWAQAREIRASGELVRLARKIECPVLAIHGSHDPHPAESIEGPLSRVVQDFRFILLDKCGHSPWKEKHARDRFFQILREELGINS